MHSINATLISGGAAQIKWLNEFPDYRARLFSIGLKKGDFEIRRCSYHLNDLVICSGEK